MTFAINGFPSATPFAFDPNTMQSVQTMPMESSVLSRKRKDLEESEHDENVDLCTERPACFKGLRKLASMTHNNGGDEQAQFLPLPPHLNMQLLMNMGFINSSSFSQSITLQQDAGSFSRPSHSPTSSFSDFGGPSTAASYSDFGGPSTPIDMCGSTESYFTKGMRRESGAEYPDFNFYPGSDNRPRTPGLLGMHMPIEPPSVGSQDANGMQVDGMEDVAPMAKQHGSHCKSIPQLHVKSEPGVSSELWAKCPDCGSVSKVDSPPISDALSYSP